jgi:hypothetical protein
MGLLDEAIREHLELKRRHGADPTEVARQESEALGPARRAAEMPASVAEPELEPEPEPFDEPEPIWDPEPVAGEPEPFFEPEPEAEPGPEPEPEPAPEPQARRVEDIVDQPTVEHPAAKPEPLPEDEAGDDGDVLEGTPEFLEETPEHDRLWFEQRPPRDFDFDD